MDRLTAPVVSARRATLAKAALAQTTQQFPFFDRGLVPKPGTRIARKIETAHLHEAAQMSE
jgi:hypothetical protein